jgi:hypothetical protein
MNDENAHPNGAAQPPPRRGEFGRHPAVNDKPISKTAMAATAADVMMLGAAMGFAVVVMMIDPNKATIEHAWASTPELDGVVDDVDRIGGPLLTACRKMRGEQQLVVEHDNGNEGAAKRKRRDGAATRQEILWAAVGTMKTRFGTLPGPATAKSEVKVLEEELRRYHMRGNPLPTGIKLYLESDPARVVKEPLPEQGIEADQHLETLLPFLFDPTKPSSLAKKVFKLQQHNKTKKVTIKKKLQGAQLDMRRAAARKNIGRVDEMAAEAKVPRAVFCKGARGGAKK